MITLPSLTQISRIIRIFLEIHKIVKRNWGQTTRCNQHKRLYWQLHLEFVRHLHRIIRESYRQYQLRKIQKALDLKVAYHYLRNDTNIK